MDAINAKIKAMRAGLFSVSDYQVLCRSRSVGQFLGLVKKRLSMEDELRRIRLFVVNTGMRRLLDIIANRDYVKSWSYIKTKVRGQDKIVLTQIKGTEIDLQNIVRIYRLKRYYPQSEIYSQLIPICYRLDKDTIKQMAESPSEKELVVAVKHTCYGHLDFGDIDVSISDEMRRVISGMTMRYPRSVAGIAAYFFARQTEIHNMTAIEEGLKYQLPPEEIFRNLML